MRQVTLFFLIVFMLMAGISAYFFPKHQAISPLKVLTDNSYYDMAEEESNTKGFQQLNMTTNRGIVQIHRRIDDLTQEQKRLMGMISYDQQGLNDINKEIADITKQIDGKSGINFLKFKVLELELKNYQRRLVAHGLQLIALNDQLNKNRQLLAEERGLVNIYSESSLQLLQQHNSLHNDQSSIFFDKVTAQSNDFLRHTQDLIDEDRQRVQDQQNR